jgi:hypothetical protein
MVKRTGEVHAMLRYCRGGRRFAAALSAALILLAAPVQGAPPELRAPDFASERGVEEALEQAVSNLKPLAEGDGRTWQGIRARAACDTALAGLRREASVRGYRAEIGERYWQDCAEQYRNVP